MEFDSMRLVAGAGLRKYKWPIPFLGGRDQVVRDFRAYKDVFYGGKSHYRKLMLLECSGLEQSDKCTFYNQCGEFMSANEIKQFGLYMKTRGPFKKTKCRINKSQNGDIGGQWRSVKVNRSQEDQRMSAEVT